LAAVSQVLHSGRPGTVVSDCRGIVLKCMAIQNGHITTEELGKGNNADLWVPLGRLPAVEPGWGFVWQPSHLTKEQAIEEGFAEDSWEGNNRADDAAKSQALAADPPPELLAKWAEQQLAVQAVWRLIAQSQVAHLAERPRRKDGAAVKSRKRKAPARPTRSTRRKGGPPPEAVGPPPGPRAEAQVPAQPVAEEQLQVQGPAAEAAAGPAAGGAGRGRVGALVAVWPSLPDTPGVHCFKPAAGPIPQAGFAKSAA
jgi:hypothetical protein